jgi:catechol 2,3-dioxygenase-like lactoylglutathione lyase family enzyme
MEVGAMIRGVHHVAVATGDLDWLVGFYRDLLGFDVVSPQTAIWAEIVAASETIPAQFAPGPHPIASTSATAVPFSSHCSRDGGSGRPRHALLAHALT